MRQQRTALASFLLLLVLPALLADDDLFVGYNATLTWEHDGKDVKGGAKTLEKAEIALSLTGMDVRKGQPHLRNISVPATVGQNQADLSPLLAGLEPGPYKLWVRVFDRAAHASDWAGPVTIRLGMSRPSPPPKNVGCMAR